MIAIPRPKSVGAFDKKAPTFFYFSKQKGFVVMIIILKKGTSPVQVNKMVSHFEQMNFQVQEIRGVHETILGLIGDTSRLDTDDIKSMDTVAEVKRIQEPYKNANRKSTRTTPSSMSAAEESAADIFRSSPVPAR